MKGVSLPLGSAPSPSHHRRKTAIHCETFETQLIFHCLIPLNTAIKSIKIPPALKESHITTAVRGHVNRPIYRWRHKSQLLQNLFNRECYHNEGYAHHLVWVWRGILPWWARSEARWPDEREAQDGC